MGTDKPSSICTQTTKPISSGHVNRLEPAEAVCSGADAGPLFQIIELSVGKTGRRLADVQMPVQSKVAESRCDA